jgi:2'-5' RNA ligase
MPGMRLFAAILPPRDVLEEVMRVVRSVDGPEPTPEEPKSRWRPFGGRSGGPTAVVQDSAKSQLTRPEVDRMYIPITGFGNVTLGDSVKLAKALRTEVASWRRPEVAFAGGAALEFKGDESVWAKLDGDIDDLRTVGRGVPHVVQRLGFFVDRRQFRPWLSVGTITDDSTAPYLESVVAALDGFRGRTWTVEAVSLMRRPADTTDPEAFEELERMPLAGS